MNEKINELYNKLDAQDEIIEQLELENASLKKDKKKAIELLNGLNIKLKDILKTGIDIKEIIDIKQVLGDKENE